MTLAHSYLLGGLVLLGVPILVHLIMRQKPKVLPFPAFRFLKLQRRTNQRRLRLQHLLLLLLRMLVIAALCLGLAAMGTSEESAVLVFDTSPSLDYRLADVDRLKEGRKQTMGFLETGSRDRQVAILDTGNSGGGSSSAWLNAPALVLGRIEGLRTRPPRVPILRQLETAKKLLQDAEGATREAPFLYIFSDFTRSGWPEGPQTSLELHSQARVVLVDLGVDNPRDLAIDRLVVKPEVVPPGGKIRIEATVRATGGSFNNEIICSFEKEPDPSRPPDRKQVQLEPGQSRTYFFERTAPPLPNDSDRTEAPCQVTVRLATTDALPVNNSRYATCLVRRPQKILVVVEDSDRARPWVVALQVVGLERPAEAFACDVQKPAEAEKLSAEAWQAYRAVCLYEVPKPSPTLWEQMARYVSTGGGLVIVPGGQEMNASLADYNAEGKKALLLPAELRHLITVPAGKTGVPWAEYRGSHPITASFRQWQRAANPDFARPEYRPFVNSYWAVEPIVGPEGVLASYEDDQKRPALLERTLGKGKVILLTVPLDGRALDGERGWHNYWKDSSFGLVLADQICRYLAGEASRPQLDFLCGQSVQIPVPSPPPPLPWTLQGPDLSASETSVQATQPGTDALLPELSLPQAISPGSYILLDGKDRPFVGFSLNMPASETYLERVPLEELEQILGRKVARVAGPGDSKESGNVELADVKQKLEEGVAILVPESVGLRELRQKSEAPWKDLLPWLMMILLLTLTLESFLANRFYRRPPTATPTEP